MNPFLTGMAAGYGIAIPVGAIAIFIIEIGLKDGFRNGFWAGAGAATADTVYATVAMFLGSLAVAALGQYVVPIKMASGIILVGLGVKGLINARASLASKGPRRTESRYYAIYTQLLGLTMLNPMTVVYFAAIILGGTVGSEMYPVSRVLFVLGAGIASLTWQTFLAVSASFFHKRFSAHTVNSISILGNFLVCGFGVNILVSVAGSFV